MVYQATPLRGVSETSGPDTAESLLISALLESGTFNPDRFHVEPDELTCWHQLWSFCTEHQRRSGKAPSLDLVRTKFPEFKYVKGIGLQWAVDEMHKEAANRRMRSSMRDALTALQDNDVVQAWEHIKTIAPLKRTKHLPVDGFEAWAEDSIQVKKIPIPYNTLKHVTGGGIGPGELWYIGARPGDGKTFTVCDYVAVAMLAGYSVGYLSLEMPARKISQRVMRDLAARNADKGMLKRLDGTYLERKATLKTLAESTVGTLAVIDPSHGKATTSVARDMMDEYELVVIDHVGLMSTGDGRKAIDDWRAMATISNQLLEDKLATNTPVLAAVQLNREADNSSLNAPKARTLSQSDALNQDADVVVTMKRYTKSAMVQSAEKNRDGAQAWWYSRFDPANARFEEISQDEAMRLSHADDDAEAAQKNS